jgi:hypothetical protein
VTGRRLGLPLLVALALLGAATAAARDAAVLPLAASLASDVMTLTAPDMEGRRSGTPGGDRAAGQLAAWLRAAGLRPGGDQGTFFQSFVVETSRHLGPANALELAGPAPRRFEVGRDWAPHGGSLVAEVEGEVLFAGHGARVEDGGWDDYAGVDARGKVVLAWDGTPPALGGARVSRLDKLIEARRHGAAALLLVADGLPSLAATPAQAGLVSGTITREAARGLRAGDRARIRVDLGTDERRAVNVVGILPGADPALAHEAVVIGAHYDHLGYQDGVVHPGADDNASGTALAVGLARAFAAAGGTGRTLVVALFGGEELGLLGSSHYVRRPAFELAHTVAMVNFDMVGRMRDGRLVVGGGDSGSGLRDVLSAAAQTPRIVLEVSGTPYGPSDHIRFYEAGVPVLFFTTGAHGDYHKPSDTADKIDAAAMADVAGVAIHAIERLAGGPRPAYARVTPPSPRGGAQGGAAGSAFLGVVVEPRGARDGLRLSGVLPGSAAAAAGLGAGDVIVRLAGTPIDGADEVRAVLREKKPGDLVRVVYLRGGDAHTTSTTLGARP